MVPMNFYLNERVSRPDALTESPASSEAGLSNEIEKLETALGDLRPDQRAALLQTARAFFRPRLILPRPIARLLRLT